MSQAIQFIRQLEELKEGERSHLRRLAGQPLDTTLAGFDLFTGVWWPLRQRSPAAPRRDTSWLIAKVHATFPIPNDPGRTLAQLLGRLEPRDEHDSPRFRARFDALLCSHLPTLEPHLRWALRTITDGINANKVAGIGLDWPQLLDDLSIWDRGEQHGRARDIRDIWAEQYLNAIYRAQGARNAD